MLSKEIPDPTWLFTPQPSYFRSARIRCILGYYVAFYLLIGDSFPPPTFSSVNPFTAFFDFQSTPLLLCIIPRLFLTFSTHFYFLKEFFGHSFFVYGRVNLHNHKSTCNLQSGFLFQFGNPFTNLYQPLV